ncbi:hypothetical protein R20943_07647 [Paraburkholderia aspalathi]|nr:hypothetical protein R20943_07647 [Paraburkholderia aspalathi]
MAELAVTAAELTRALRRTKYHLVTSQLLVSGAMILALKFIH